MRKIMIFSLLLLLFSSVVYAGFGDWIVGILGFETGNGELDPVWEAAREEIYGPVSLGKSATSWVFVETQSDPNIKATAEQFNSTHIKVSIEEKRPLNASYRFDMAVCDTGQTDLGVTGRTRVSKQKLGKGWCADSSNDGYLIQNQLDKNSLPREEFIEISQADRMEIYAGDGTAIILGTSLATSLDSAGDSICLNDRGDIFIVYDAPNITLFNTSISHLGTFDSKIILENSFSTLNPGIICNDNRVYVYYRLTGIGILNSTDYGKTFESDSSFFDPPGTEEQVYAVSDSNNITHFVTVTDSGNGPTYYGNSSSPTDYSEVSSNSSDDVDDCSIAIYENSTHICPYVTCVGTDLDEIEIWSSCMNGWGNNSGVLVSDISSHFSTRVPLLSIREENFTITYSNVFEDAISVFRTTKDDITNWNSDSLDFTSAGFTTIGYVSPGISKQTNVSYFLFSSSNSANSSIHSTNSTDKTNLTLKSTSNHPKLADQDYPYSSRLNSTIYFVYVNQTNSEVYFDSFEIPGPPPPPEIYELNTTNLLFYHALDEGTGSIATDTSEHGINATLTETTWNKGVNGTGLEIPERTGKAVISDSRVNTNYTTTGFIAMMWVRLYENVSNQYFFEKANSYRLSLEGSGTQLRARTFGYADNSATGNFNMPREEWVQIALVFDTINQIIVVNNQTIVTDDVGTGAFANNSADLVYGWDDGFSFPVKGIIDEFAFYNSSDGWQNLVNDHFELKYKGDGEDTHVIEMYQHPWCSFDAEDSGAVRCSYGTWQATNTTVACTDNVQVSNSTLLFLKDDFKIDGSWSSGTPVSCNVSVEDYGQKTAFFEDIQTTTKKDSGYPFRFAVFADSSADEAQGGTVETFIPLIESHNPNFSICVGDCLGHSGTATVPSFIKNFTDTWNTSLSFLNYFHIVGNHETITTPTARDFYPRIFHNPNNGVGDDANYAQRGFIYSFNYSHGLFVGINSEDQGFNINQFQWVSGQLNESTQPWKWVFTHDSWVTDKDEIRGFNQSMIDLLNATNATSIGGGINNICHNTTHYYDLEFTVPPIGDNAQSTGNCNGDVAISQQAFAIIDIHNATFANISFFGSSDELIYNFTILRDAPAAPEGDTTLPTLSALIENPSSPATYNPDTTYIFNATVTDDISVGTVFISFNQSNTTATNSGDNYTASFNPLAAGVYNYYWWANDSSGNENRTNSQTYTINQNVSNVTLSFNDTSSINYLEDLISSCTVNTGEESAILTRNGTVITSGQSQSLGAGDYFFNCSYSGSQNYTFSQDTFLFTVSPISPMLSIDLSPSSTVESGTETTATGQNCPSQLSCEFTRDNASVSNPETDTLSVGNYEYIYNTSGNQNYTAQNVSSTLTVQDTTAPTLSGYTNLSTDNVSSIIYFGCSEQCNYTLLAYNNTERSPTYLVYQNSNSTLATNHSPFLDGLLNFTTYYLNLTIFDEYDNSLTNNSFNFTTAQNPPGVDSTPPVISSLTNVSTTNSSSGVSWSCDENCNYTISLYNNTNRNPNTLFSTISNATLATSHIPFFSGLMNSTTYFVNLSVFDSVGNEAINNSFNFMTATNPLDILSGPVISSLANYSTTNSSSGISWGCSENCNYSIALYNNSDRSPSNLFTTLTNGTLTSSPSPFFTGLMNSTTYFVNLTVFNLGGYSSTNNSFSFTTSTNPPAPPPPSSQSNGTQVLWLNYSVMNFGGFLPDKVCFGFADGGSFCFNSSGVI